MCMKNACPKKTVSKSGVGFSVVYEVCLPYPIFCFTRIIHKIHGNVVQKMLKYWKFPQNSSPIDKNVDNFMLTWNLGIISCSSKG